MNNLDTFLREVWEGNNVIGNFSEEVFSSNEDIRKASFFPDAELNFAENLLVGDITSQLAFMVKEESV